MTGAERLRDALWSYAKGEISAEDWTPNACRAVFAAAGIPLTDGQLEVVAKVFRQTPFYGGNFTLDANRLLAALAEVQP